MVSAGMDKDGPSPSSMFNFLSTLFQVWSIRCAVVMSLAFQILLVFLAPLRKRSTHSLTNIAIWLAYLLADWIPIYAINSILTNERKNCTHEAHDTAPLWAPFMLFHLGGPDSITAFSLEDNELWIRHLIRLAAQLVAVIYVYYLRRPPSPWSAIGWLIFAAGVIKYGERTRSLYLASLGTVKDSMRPKPDPGPNYPQLREDYSSMREARFPAEIDIVMEPERDTRSGNGGREEWDQVKVIREGYRFYRIFRGLIVDHVFSIRERNESKEYFSNLEAEFAFRVMEVELSFMYDELFTKMATLYRNWYGFFSRLVCSVLILVAWLIFLIATAQESLSSSYNTVSPFSRHDFLISSTLFGGAIVLELLALVKILFSHWNLATMAHNSFLHKVVRAVHGMVSSQHRWFTSVSQFNLIDDSLNKRCQWMDPWIDYFGLKGMFNRLRVRRSCNIDMDKTLKEFIFNGLRGAGERAKGPAKEMCNSRDKQAIADYVYPQYVIDSVVAIEYDESVLLWHITTDLLYFTLEESHERDDDDNNYNRQICKILSDYMVYLAELKPKMMSAIAGISKIRFQDTRAEAMRFFQGDNKLVTNHKEACEELLRVDTSVKPSKVKGDRCKSLLFDACILAKDLKTIGDRDKMWGMMSKVWLELLCYCAKHCPGSAHAQQLSRGGQLLTLVWLLMAHLGLGHQFKMEAGHARAKLILNWEQQREQAEHEHAKHAHLGLGHQKHL